MDLDINSFLVVGLISISVFFLLYVLLSKTIGLESSSESRDPEKVIKGKKNNTIPSEALKRRKALRDAMDKIELSHKEKVGNTKSLSSLISYSGIPFSKQHFYIFSFVMGLVFGIISLALFSSFFVSLCVCLSSSLVFPRVLLQYLIKKRIAKFLNEFPNALDIIVRSVRSGLPVSDAISIIVGQSSDPVRSEFRRVVEAQHLGLSVSESVARMIRYMPLQEVSFFSTVISVQAQSGGNLSEALSNLSGILRERKKMKGKVQALAMEAKASAWIIGSLPFCVSLLVHFTSPGYIDILFLDPRGHIILGIAAFLMVLGAVVMRAMINFDV
ncbi:type II secretion system F family protein [Candidatus Liberibacter solanacearum]|uniref:Pilus assembly protein n=1 Tax=Candidatus Liberibacter solanacearum TaxID=556287 RepID=A0A1V2N914_9HYPH|nr:type II secretion system F family protein [Candidatus Liberibacter solanacearum]ONI59829.1 pilus assembly protein [Candidatus Liberibacter solanacearum]ONI60059.1 pilus assembly protein [Candidatus Liberibacter solanacearum]